MARLQQILMAAKEGLQPWEPIPEAKWPAIASQCGAAEVVEIQARITSLKTELADVEEWDGDTQDDIHKAITLFEGLLRLVDR